MDKEVATQLSRSPHPLSWAIAISILIIGAFAVESVVVGLLAGIAIGAYFGNYSGRSAVLEAWRLQVQKDSERQVAKLETRHAQRNLIK